MNSQEDPDQWEPGRPWKASATGGFSYFFIFIGLISALFARSKDSGAGPYNFGPCLPSILFVIFMITGCIFGIAGVIKDKKSLISWIGITLSIFSLILTFRFILP